jgi:hypothetical protein
MCAAHARQFVVDHLTMPSTANKFALDLNGDATPDNRYAELTASASATGLDVQGVADARTTAGDTILLVGQTSADATFTTDTTCAQATAVLGLPHPSPNFSGNGRFQQDPAEVPGVFSGPIAAGMFNSASPATATVPVRLDLELPFSGIWVRVPIVGAHIIITGVMNGKISGQINGALRDTEFQTRVVPKIAQGYTDFIASNPNSTSAMQIASILDIGNGMGADCVNPDGTHGVAGDKKIAPCELSNSTIFKNVTSPDVRMFDAQGNYHPDPANTPKDSMSVGFGFTAVAATIGPDLPADSGVDAPVDVAVTPPDATSCPMIGSAGCRQCVCGSCAPELSACAVDAGCTAIVTCTLNARCAGSACYTAGDGGAGPCKAVIDANGGPAGASVAKVTTLATCSTNAGCPAVCAADAGP